MSGISASEYVSHQDELEQQARELMPWDPKLCTYEMGPLRQSVFACRTHDIGLCYSCSIQCHTKCDIVELFTKRHFNCDCGTERDGQNPDEQSFRCRLRENREPDVPCLTNRYGQNFKGLFCECQREYDPDSDDAMIQCILGSECNEDWYHESCIGKTKKIPALESFDAYICWKCVKKYDYYFKRILSHPLGEQIVAHTLDHVIKGEKNEVGDSELKNSRMKRSAEESNNYDYSIFLKEGYQDKLKELKNSIEDHNDKLYLFLNDLVPFLIKDEPVYEPADDIEENSPDDLISNVLKTAMHREQAIAGISAFNTLKVKLNEFLKPFAETGNVVKEEDIKGFFQRPEEKNTTE